MLLNLAQLSENMSDTNPPYERKIVDAQARINPEAYVHQRDQTPLPCPPHAATQSPTSDTTLGCILQTLGQDLRAQRSASRKPEPEWTPEPPRDREEATRAVLLDE